MSSEAGSTVDRPEGETVRDATRSEEAATGEGGHSRREYVSSVTGQSNYVDDVTRSDVAHLAFVRSQHGHATIEEIDTGAVENAEGVIGVFTAADVESSGIPGIIPTGSSLYRTERTNCQTELTVPDRPLLAGEKVRYMGEPIAAIVAEDPYTAYNCTDDVVVEYERLDAVTDPSAAGTDTVSVHDSVPDNVSFDWEIGDRSEIDRVFENADNTARIDRSLQKLVANPIEPRGALATYDPSADTVTITVGSQIPHLHKLYFCDVLGIDQHKIRVKTPDIGGGFGAKSKFYSEEPLTAWCAMQLHQPVTWRATRSEAFAADVQGRCHSTVGEIAFDDDGTIQGLRVRSDKDLGAYVSRAAPIICTGSYAALLSGQYQIPHIYCRVTGSFTNTTPTDAVRGSDRPEATFLVERLLDAAARELDVDPETIRRRNFIPSTAFPYQTPVGAEYDSGRYEAALDRALEIADYDELRAKQRALRDEGRYLGIGIGCFVEKSGSPKANLGTDAERSSTVSFESSRIVFHPSGTVSAFAGSADQGQRHEVSFTQIVAEELGIEEEDVVVREGDTVHLSHGTGTFSSRSTIMAGNSLARSSEKIVDQAREIAAVHFGVEPDRVEFADGAFFVRGTPGETVDIQTIAQWAYRGTNLPADTEPGLEASTFYTSNNFTFPYGAHVAVVEIDASTGDIELSKYVAVDDVGTQITPEIVEGQIVGGIVHGIGQALHEDAIYQENGTLVSTSFKEYSLPRADDIPRIETDTIETPSPHNYLGVKGAGESGSIGAPAAIANAVVDALRPFGVSRVDLPIRSEDVWERLREEE